MTKKRTPPDTTWWYTDGTQRTVFRTHPDGRMESHVVTAHVIRDWLAAGNTPEPAPDE